MSKDAHKYANEEYVREYSVGQRLQEVLEVFDDQKTGGGETRIDEAVEGRGNLVASSEDDDDDGKSLEELLADGGKDNRRGCLSDGGIPGRAGDKRPTECVAQTCKEDGDSPAPEEGRDLGPPGFGFEAVNELQEEDDDAQGNQADDREKESNERTAANKHESQARTDDNSFEHRELLRGCWQRPGVHSLRSGLRVLDGSGRRHGGTRIDKALKGGGELGGRPLGCTDRLRGEAGRAGSLRGEARRAGSLRGEAGRAGSLRGDGGSACNGGWDTGLRK